MSLLLESTNLSAIHRNQRSSTVNFVLSTRRSNKKSGTKITLQTSLYICLSLSHSHWSVPKPKQFRLSQSPFSALSYAHGNTISCHLHMHVPAHNKHEMNTHRAVIVSHSRNKYSRTWAATHIHKVRHDSQVSIVLTMGSITKAEIAIYQQWICGNKHMVCWANIGYLTSSNDECLSSVTNIHWKCTRTLLFVWWKSRNKCRTHSCAYRGGRNIFPSQQQTLYAIQFVERQTLRASSWRSVYVCCCCCCCYCFSFVSFCCTLSDNRSVLNRTRKVVRQCYCVRTFRQSLKFVVVESQKRLSVSVSVWCVCGAVEARRFEQTATAAALLCEYCLLWTYQITHANALSIHMSHIYYIEHKRTQTTDG